MALPNPIPDNPLKWDGWRSYSSPNFYERLGLDVSSNATADVIEENCRQLLVWWKKKLPLKNQPSNPMAQLLRQALDEAPNFLAEARTKLLDPAERAKIDEELHKALISTTIEEFKKLIAFILSEKKLTEESEQKLYSAGRNQGLSDEDIQKVLDSELERTGSVRVKAEPPPPPPPPPAPVAPPVGAPAPASAPMAPAASGSPEDEFRRLLRMSRLCLDGDDMTDDQRDALCNMGESCGLTGGQAEDLIDEYLEEASTGIPATPTKPVAPAVARPAPTASKPPVAPARPAVPVRPTTPAPAAKPPTPSGSSTVTSGIRSAAKEFIISPIGRAMEKQKYPNFVNCLGMEFFLIPSGQFNMGGTDPDAQYNEEPVTPVKLSCYYMARFQVTNADFEAFDKTHSNKRGGWADDSHPVIYVSAVEAEAFCKWLSDRDDKKYRLPTEAEWEYAAKGDDGRIFPWGNALSAGNLANFADAKTSFAWRDPGINDGFAETSPVGSFPRGASPFGIEDLSGNVFEWTMDSLDTYKGKEVINPRVIKTGVNRVYRGGSWKSRVSSLRASARNSNVPNYQTNDVGFRIVCECPA